MDVGYGSEDVIFTGWLYKTDISLFNEVNRSQYGRVTDFKQNNTENTDNICYNTINVIVL